MSAPPHNDTLLQPGVSMGSMPMSGSRLLAPSTVPSTSKRICFYRSGDPQFVGHRIVINSRTFKTFDALLDALSKKVPLPFGVRTITTPRGTHHIRSLDDLRDGGSYVCSDQKRIKPLNLDEVNRRQVPWNTTRPASAGRHARRGLIRQLAKKSEVARTGKMSESAAKVWTPKRLVVFKNRDPSFKRTLVLQKRIAPTFEALLDYLSQVMQFPVLKLYTADGRRVDGLPALILCSGVVVAAGNEPFRLINYSLQGSSQPSQSALSESVGLAKTQSVAQNKKKQVGSRSRSRNFSLSSERFIVNQISSSLNGSLSEVNGHRTGSLETENSQGEEAEEIGACDYVGSTGDQDHCIMPSEDDIEKSFRVNQDGSMTVEMKVRLTIKQEEMIQWTTTLSRTCVNGHQRAVCSQPVSAYNSPDINELPLHTKRYNCKFKENMTPTDKSVGLKEETEDHCESAISEILDKPKPAFRRVPTPGPRHVRRKEASVENIKRVSQTEVHESMVGAYSYMECTAEGERTEGYRVVSHSSSSSTRPVAKPRKTSTGETKHKRSHSSLRSTAMAEVLQLKNNGAEITETVMHIYESQGTYENYFANPQLAQDQAFEYRTKCTDNRKPDSTDSGPRSSSNDCDIDLSRESTSSDSHNARKKELLSLSSGQSSPFQKTTNNLSLISNSENHERDDLETSHDEDSRGNKNDHKKKKVTQKSVKLKKNGASETTKSDRKQKVIVQNLRQSKSPETQIHTELQKKTVSSAESEKHRQKAKKKGKSEGSQKSHSPNLNSGEEKESDKDCNLEDSTNLADSVNTNDSSLQRDLSQNENLCHTDTLKLPFKKKSLGVLPSHHSAPLKKPTKQRSMNAGKIKAHDESRELTESVSMPALHSSQSSVHQYVENWLRKIQPESVPYMEEMDPCQADTEPKPRVEFHIGSGSAESSEIRSDLEKDNILEEETSSKAATPNRQASQPPVQIRCEGEPVETERLRSFCKSMPSVRIQPAEQDSRTRIHKSSEALLPMQPNTVGHTSQNEDGDFKSGIKPVMKQLCLSIQSIRRVSSDSHLTSLEKEKSSSLPDFSSQVASVFGSPSKALLSFLSVMTLRDGVSNTSNENTNSGSYPEALQVMQSLEKIASIEDEEELKASLSSLKSSTSSHLKKSWRDFQERKDREESPPLSPRYSEQEFALEVNSDGEDCDFDKERDFGLKELMDELNIPDDLRREISSLVDGKLGDFDDSKLANTNSGQINQTTDSACDNEEGAVDGILEASLGEERGCSGEQKSLDGGIKESEQKAEPNISEGFEKLCTTCPPEPAHWRKDLDMDGSGIVNNIQPLDDETSQTILVNDTSEMLNNIHDVQKTCLGEEDKDNDLDNEAPDTVAKVQPSEEKNTDEEAVKKDLIKEVSEVMDKASVSEENYTENDTCQVEEEAVDNQSAKEKKIYQEDEACIESESEDLQDEVDIQTSEIESTDHFKQDSEVSYVQDTERENENMKKDCLDEHNTSKEKEETYQKRSNYSKHPDVTSVGSNTEEVESHHCSEADEKNTTMEEYVLDEKQERADQDQDSAFDHGDDCSLDKEENNSDEDQRDDAESYHSNPSIGDCESEAHYSHISEARSEDLEVESCSKEHDQEVASVEQEDDANDKEDAKSESCECITDSNDAHSRDLGPVEGQDYNDSNATLSEALESEEPNAKQQHSSDQDCESYDEDKLQESEKSFKPQESEDEHHELQSVTEDEERVPEETATSAEGKAEAHLDEDEDDANDKEDAKSESCECITDSDDAHSRDLGPVEGQDYNDSNATLSEALESEEPNAKQNHFSDQDCESYDEDKLQESEESFKPQESEDEHHKLQSVTEDEERVPEETATSAEGKAEAHLDEDEDEDDTNDKEDAKSESCECITDSDDAHSRDLGPVEGQDYNDSNATLSEALESEEPNAKQHHFSDQDCESYDEDKLQESEESFKPQESEDEHHELQSVTEDEERVPEENATSAEGKAEAHEDEDEDEDEDDNDSSLDSDKDFGSEQCYPVVVDQDDEPYDQDKSKSCEYQESEVEQVYEDASSIEENDESENRAEEQSNTLDSEKDFSVHSHQYMSEPDQDQQNQEFQRDDAESCHSEPSIGNCEPAAHYSHDSDARSTDLDVEQCSKNSVIRESCESQDTDNVKTESEDTEGQEEDPAYVWPPSFPCVNPIEISQELLDFVNLALLSSALTFTYDTNGHLRIEQDICKIREMSLAKSDKDDQYVQRHLPSPNMSDLSDYRPETSCSGGNLSQVSTDLFTESGEEEEKLFICQGNVKQSFEKVKRCTKILANGSMRIHPETDTAASPSLKSMNSLASFNHSFANYTTQDPALCNTPGSFHGDSEPIHSVAFHSDSNEGVLIEKGRWLLKENHLIRKSPPVPMGMYENLDTTSADTLQENTSEDVPYAPCGSQQSPLAVISSSELEEMAKPPTPKCMYFNMPHSSDSDPFMDDQSISSNNRGGEIRKSREFKVAPMGDTLKMCAKKNGSLPSFASVEFKMSDGKVHPEGGVASGALVKSARPQSSSSRTAQEEESVEGLNLRCGRHCPIL